MGEWKYGIQDTVPIGRSIISFGYRNIAAVFKILEYGDICENFFRKS